MVTLYTIFEFEWAFTTVLLSLKLIFKYKNRKSPKNHVEKSFIQNFPTPPEDVSSNVATVIGGMACLRFSLIWTLISSKMVTFNLR